MTKYSLPTVGLALLWGVAFLGQAPAKAGEASCGCNAGCASCGCEAGCASCGCKGGCGDCDNCCPHCGCKLVPVCQITCTMKKTTIHEHCCKCKEICIPGIAPLCHGCDACDCCNSGCKTECDCHCRVREVHKLMVCPVTKETPVRECTVQWVCPKCSQGNFAPSVTPARHRPWPRRRPRPWPRRAPRPRTTSRCPRPQRLPRQCPARKHPHGPGWLLKSSGKSERERPFGRRHQLSAAEFFGH